MDHNNLGTNLRILRTIKNLSCVELGYEIGISSYKIHHIEHNRNVRITNAEIQDICNYFKEFNVTQNDLFNKKATITFI